MENAEKTSTEYQANRLSTTDNSCDIEETEFERSLDNADSGD